MVFYLNKRTGSPVVRIENVLSMAVIIVHGSNYMRTELYENYMKLNSDILSLLLSLQCNLLKALDFGRLETIVIIFTYFFYPPLFLKLFVGSQSCHMDFSINGPISSLPSPPRN